MKTKLIIGSIVVVAVLIGGALMRTGSIGRLPADDVSNEHTATAVGSAVIEGAMQYVDITARGGYSPKVTKAKAGVPTTIRMHTENTYDCSSALVIPALDVEVRLKAAGIEEIPVPVDKAGGTLEGLCSMGMYHFSVVFE